MELSERLPLCISARSVGSVNRTIAGFEMVGINRSARLRLNIFLQKIWIR